MVAVWCLNVDAEIELGTRGPYTRSQTTRAQVRAAIDSARSVLKPGDKLLSQGEDFTGWTGRAWCMTTRAREALEAKGALPVESPPLKVLKHVNDRAFAANISQPLKGAQYFQRADDVFIHASSEDPFGNGWLAKRAFAVAKKGQRRLERPLSELDRNWVERSLSIGGLQLEPFVVIEDELVVHGLIESGSFWLSKVKPHAGHAFRNEIDPAHAKQAIQAAQQVAQALVREGYFGPFGVDAYCYRVGGEMRVNPLSEVNARYTIGWEVTKTIAARTDLVQSA